jgi:hypothetical protein
MVHFKDLRDQRAQAIELGKKFARWITESFFKPPMTARFSHMHCMRLILTFL